MADGARGHERWLAICFARDIATDVLRAIACVDYWGFGAGVGESEVLVVVFTKRLDAIGDEFAAEVVGGDGVAPVLHPPSKHFSTGEVTDDAANVCAVLCREGCNGEEERKEYGEVFFHGRAIAMRRRRGIWTR